MITQNSNSWNGEPVLKNLEGIAQCGVPNIKSNETVTPIETVMKLADSSLLADNQVGNAEIDVTLLPWSSVGVRNTVSLNGDAVRDCVFHVKPETVLDNSIKPVTADHPEPQAVGRRR